MSLDLGAVGRRTPRTTCRWDSRDAMLYALAVGAGQQDPYADLAFTTENTAGTSQHVMPTFAAVLTDFGAGAGPDIGRIDMTRLVHAEQSVELLRPLPASGTLEVSTEVTGIYDKGSGALVVTESSGWLPDDDTEPSVRTRSSVFIKDAGGFGTLAPRVSWSAPPRQPDIALDSGSRADQALLYRLTGDRNPLHSDPDFASRAGFEKPILHGMCTFGIVGRVLLNELCGGDPARFSSMSARFSQPVLPGDPLTVHAWHDEHGVTFRVSSHDGIVMDRGSMTFRP